MNAEISETEGAKLLRFGVKIPELLTQRKFVSVETNLRCIRSSGTCTPNLNSLAPIVSKISAFIRTDRQTDIDSANDPDQEYLYPLLEE